VLVVGNPANTNALIAMKNAPSLKPQQFTAMMRLDHNRRAHADRARRPATPVSAVTKMTIWGNHSATQYPDLFQAEVGGEKAWPMINDQAWLESTFIPTVQKRGAAIIEARGLSSAASAGQRRHRPCPRLVARHAQTATGSAWASRRTASYGIPEGVLSGYPVTCKSGSVRNRQGH
jgi:malate dehydrogenase